MSDNLMYSPSGIAPFAYNAPRPTQARGMSLRPRPLLVSDGGDDYEMSEDIAKAFVRAGDRLMGFMTGAAVLGAIWLTWSLI
jgi:hypothetical protein